MSVYLSLTVHSVIFGIFYTLIFLFLNKSSIIKVKFASIFFFTLIMYFVLSLLLGKYILI
ncbi:MAG: hypothetical protein FWD54_00045 [Endomicrobia bacterium]|nr:hypothetical protein [Endomicrobiia bacterium]MCL2798664.1 hypothetical protein [Endomicrobiia bacterium]